MWEYWHNTTRGTASVLCFSHRRCPLSSYSYPPFARPRYPLYALTRAAGDRDCQVTRCSGAAACGVTVDLSTVGSPLSSR